MNCIATIPENPSKAPMVITTNLDGMDVDELREFANDKTNNVILRRYAKMKAKAMECRLGGDIQAALQLESMADRIYQRLPEELKW